MSSVYGPCGCDGHGTIGIRTRAWGRGVGVRPKCGTIMVQDQRPGESHKASWRGGGGRISETALFTIADLPQDGQAHRRRSALCGM